MKVPHRIRKLILGMLLPLALLLLWHMAAKGSVIVPSVGDVLNILLHPMREATSLDAAPLAHSLCVTLLRVAIGFGTAILTGIPLGLLIGRIKWGGEVFSPFLSAAMVVSPIAWLPITILVFGLSSPATVVFGDDAWKYGILDQLRFAIITVIWMGSFFPILLNTAAGARGVRESHIEAAKALGASRIQILWKIILPSAAPTIFTGLHIGAGIAWRAIIAAEIFPGTRSGLGHTISVAHGQAAYEYAFAAIVVVAVVGLALDGLIRLIATPITHWQPKER